MSGRVRFITLVMQDSLLALYVAQCKRWHFVVRAEIGNEKFMICKNEIQCELRVFT